MKQIQENKNMFNKNKGACNLSISSSKIGIQSSYRKIIFLLLLSLGMMQCTGKRVSPELPSCPNGTLNTGEAHDHSSDEALADHEHEGVCLSCNSGFYLLAGNCIPYTVSVIWDINGGSGGVLPPNQVVRAGEPFILPSLEGATRAGGFISIGWSTLRGDEIGANFVRFNETYTIPTINLRSATLTFYAVWGQAYRVTYDLNGGTGGAVTDSMSYTAGATSTIQNIQATTNRPASASNSPNNGFFGWGVNANGTGRTYNVGERALFASNTTLYALWYYPVTYNGDSGMGTLPANHSTRTGAIFTPTNGTLLTKTISAVTSSLTWSSVYTSNNEWSRTGSSPGSSSFTMPNEPLALTAVYKRQSQSYEIQNNGSSAYTFAGLGDNPTLNATSGERIIFILKSITGHPFSIKTLQGPGTGNRYNGIGTELRYVNGDSTPTTGNTAQAKQAGILTWTIRNNLTGTYYYQCENHNAMNGRIVITAPVP